MTSPRAAQLRRLVAGLLTAAALALCLGLAGATATTEVRGPVVAAEHGQHAVLGALGHVAAAGIHARPLLELSVPAMTLVLAAFCAFVFFGQASVGERHRPRSGNACRAPPYAAR
jgi:hypothetical protein